MVTSKFQFGGGALTIRGLKIVLFGHGFNCGLDREKYYSGDSELLPQFVCSIQKAIVEDDASLLIFPMI